MKHSRRAKIGALVLGALVFLASQAGRGQEEEEENAVLTGKVVDIEKKAVENADITFMNISGNRLLSERLKFVYDAWPDS